jgi:hypothetical protein
VHGWRIGASHLARGGQIASLSTSGGGAIEYRELGTLPGAGRSLGADVLGKGGGESEVLRGIMVGGGMLVSSSNLGGGAFAFPRGTPVRSRMSE